MKIGFIGCGNMAQAIMGGILKKELCKAEEIIVSDKLTAAMDKVASQYHVIPKNTNNEVVKEADVLILAVKPMYYQEVIAEIKDGLTSEHIIISIAPGKTLLWLTQQLERTDCKLVRTMPNTPALVGEGITGVCYNSMMQEKDKEIAMSIFESFGKAEVIPEHLMDVVVSVSGSSPAYVFMFIEAMADAAVADGMPRAQAYTFAAQSVLGSAKMVLETGKHPGELKDMVCSPGGTTIEAVSVLEEKGMRSAVIEAMRACTKKAKGC